MERVYSRKCNDCTHRVTDETGKVTDCSVNLFGNLNCRGYNIDKTSYEKLPRLTFDEAISRIKLMYKSTDEELAKTKIGTILSILNRVVL